MKIFHLLKHVLHGAGNAYAVIDLACVQAREGHSVYVCSSLNDFEALLAQHGVESIVISQTGGLARTLAALFKLHRNLRTIRPDIVHTHMMMSTLLAAALRPLLRFKQVTTVHNEFQRSAIVITLGQRVIGVSEAVSRSMIKRGVPPSRMRTVLNGTIHSVRRAPPLPLPLVLKRPAMVTVCGLHPRKGIPDLIHAYGIVAARLPSTQLYIVGSGPCGEAYRALAHTIGAEGITFLGHIKDPRPVLLGADIFVLASHAEPAGLVLSEAREAGCAVVATNVGGNPEMLDNGEAGMLVPPQRPDLMAEAILGLLLDPAALAAARARSKRNLSRFTVERVWAETKEVYKELLV